MTKGKTEFGASVICMDHINFERDVRLAEEIGVDYLHLDVMDGRAVPRYGLYPEIVRRLASVTELPMDLHLMVDDVEFALTQFEGIPNIKNVTFHIDDNQGNALRIIDAIHAFGARPGVVANLATPYPAVARLFDHEEIDLIMFMGIHPGVLVQTARPEMVIKDITAFADEVQYQGIGDVTIQIDGGVSFQTLNRLLDAGVTSFVGGTSTIYKNVDRNDNWIKQSSVIRSNMKTINDIIS